MNRDNFPPAIIRVIAERAAYICSNPECRIVTISPHSKSNKSLSKGVAAHVYAASPGGPRYDPNQSKEVRMSPENGIWLCHNCSDTVDKDKEHYTGEILLGWRQLHIEYVRSLSQHQEFLPRGGNGGHIIIFANTIQGSGKIEVNGGDGPIGGNAGKIEIEARVNKYNGELSANGGKSTRH
jgi:hypothetical protein